MYTVKKRPLDSDHLCFVLFTNSFITEMEGKVILLPTEKAESAWVDDVQYIIRAYTDLTVFLQSNITNCHSYMVVIVFTDHYGRQIFEKKYKISLYKLEISGAFLSLRFDNISVIIRQKNVP